MPLFDPWNNELISLIKINRDANTRLDVSGTLSLYPQEREFSEREGEIERMTGVRGVMHNRRAAGWVAMRRKRTNRGIK